MIGKAIGGILVAIISIVIYKGYTVREFNFKFFLFFFNFSKITKKLKA